MENAETPTGHMTGHMIPEEDQDRGLQVGLLGLQLNEVHKLLKVSLSVSLSSVIHLLSALRCLSFTISSKGFI